MTQIGSYQCELEPAVAAEEAFESRKDGRDKKEGWKKGGGLNIKGWVEIISLVVFHTQKGVYPRPCAYYTMA